MEPIHDFKIRGGCLVAVDRASRKATATHRPFATQVVQCLPIDGGVIVREDYYGFPPGESNVYCPGQNLQLLWRTELPSVTDVYANPVSATDAGLVCASWEGDTCTLDPATGRIRGKAFTK